MKLELVKKFGLPNIGDLLTATVLNKDMCIFLSYNKEDKPELLVVTPDELAVIDLHYTAKYYELENSPVLFSMDNHFGVVNNAKELLLYSDKNKTPEVIKIQNHEILPSRFNLSNPSPVNENGLLPICFESSIVRGEPRYMAFLKLDIVNKEANWESWKALEAKAFAHHHKNEKHPPKLDSVMVKNGELHIFTSGEQIVSVYKWGMDYYAYIKCNTNGKVSETLINSGDLHSIDQKKRGVNGLFSSSQKYLILTPLFSSCEWKGKQKIFSLETGELSDIDFPRGFGKRPKIMQHYEDYFWIFLRDTLEIAICIER